jgi:hypothetical protein
VYRTRRDLLGQAETDPPVMEARAALLGEGPVRDLVVELSGWPGEVISSHKSAGQHYHKLAFLADLGLRSDDPGMAAVIPRVMDHASAEGPFRLPALIPKVFGGSGEVKWAWALCDAPVSLYALARFGLQGDPALQRAAGHLAGLVRANGWPCAVSPELGKFRGPGRKEDPCPYANLAMVKALSALDRWREGPEVRAGAETLLALWHRSREEHPYMFYMGHDFRKLKAPFIWYDLMHVLAVLAPLPWLRGDPRLAEMAASMAARADPTGRFTPESVWTAWKGWEFGQKREPSRWLTLAAWRILRDVGDLGETA